jgi:hypothetical protein
MRCSSCTPANRVSSKIKFGRNPKHSANETEKLCKLSQPRLGPIQWVRPAKCSQPISEKNARGQCLIWPTKEEGSHHARNCRHRRKNCCRSAPQCGSCIQDRRTRGLILDLQDVILRAGMMAIKLRCSAAGLQPEPRGTKSSGHRREGQDNGNENTDQWFALILPPRPRTAAAEATSVPARAPLKPKVRIKRSRRLHE